MNAQMKEIRQLLLGRFVRGEDGCLTARPAGQRTDLRGVQGVSTGWGAVHFLGIAHREQCIPIPAGTAPALLEDAMKALGRPVRLETSPELSACLIQRLMASPVVLTVCRDGAELEATAYTARGLASPLTCRRTLRALEKTLEEQRARPKK